MAEQLIDNFGRVISYLRMSGTDRCDFRCVYCMAEEMTFLPRSQVLSFEELDFIGRAFIELGVKKIRVTGGEPLVRKDICQLLNSLGGEPGLQELALTTNGSQLEMLAPQIKEAGVSSLNVSIDSLNPEKFHRITRVGDLEKVKRGLKAASEQSFQRIKINAVIMRGSNDDEIIDLLEFALENQFDISYIEEMPLGKISEHDRALAFCPSHEIREEISERYQLEPLSDTTGGPSKYWRIPGFRSRVGFISPHSANFCGECNRVRLTAEGRLLLCLGNEHSVDLRHIVHTHPGDMAGLKEAIVASMQIKPERHYFNLEKEPQIVRFMNATGG